MANTVLYNPNQGGGQIQRSGVLAYQQIPTVGLAPGNLQQYIDGYEALQAGVATYKQGIPYAPFAPLFIEVPGFSHQSQGGRGTTLNTQGRIFQSVVGYDPIPLLATGDRINPVTIATYFSLTPSTLPNFGYGGFSTHTVNLDLFVPAGFDPNTVAFIPVAGNRARVLDDAAGFQLSFNLQVQETTGLGLAMTMTTAEANGNFDGLELRFIRDYYSPASGQPRDAIALLDANFNIVQTTRRINLDRDVTYRVVAEDGFFGLAQGSTLLMVGDLVSYNFDPSDSMPALPDVLNPYETSSYLFIGDNSDRGSAQFRLGRTTLGDFSRRGTEGSDRIRTNRNRPIVDFVNALGGNDFIRTFGGDDYINGGPGDDTINGGAGNNTIDGGAGDDTIIFGNGFDSINGGTGFDTLRIQGRFILSNAGSLARGVVVDRPNQANFEATLPTAFDSRNPLLVNLQAGASFANIERLEIRGTGQADIVNAFYENTPVHITGGNGSDQLFGGTGNDVLIGGRGRDILNGFGAVTNQSTIDILTGGGGRDRFVLADADLHNSAYYVKARANDYAVITDFQRGLDEIVLYDYGIQLANYTFADTRVSYGTVTNAQATSITVGGDLIAYLVGMRPADLSASDFVFVRSDR